MLRSLSTRGGLLRRLAAVAPSSAPPSALESVGARHTMSKHSFAGARDLGADDGGVKRLAGSAAALAAWGGLYAIGRNNRAGGGRVTQPLPATPWIQQPRFCTSLATSNGIL